MPKGLTLNVEPERSRVVRGASWHNPADMSRAPYRSCDYPGLIDDALGIRLAHDNTKGEQHEKEE